MCCSVRTEELSSRYKWMCLKKILLEYGITDTPSVNVTWNLVRLIGCDIYIVCTISNRIFMIIVIEKISIVIQ